LKRKYFGRFRSKNIGIYNSRGVFGRLEEIIQRERQ